MTPPTTLAELLQDLYTHDELLRWLRSLSKVEDLSQGVRPGAALATLADEAAELLRRRGYVDGDLFDGLIRKSPKREADIRAVQANVLGSAPPVASTPTPSTAAAPPAAQTPAGSMIFNAPVTITGGQVGPGTHLSVQVSSGTTAPAPGPAPAAGTTSTAAQPATTANAPTQPVRILHLSDLHLRDGTTWESDAMLARLVAKVRELAASGRKPDLIAITGDLAYSGQKRDYQLVEKWLKGQLLPAAGLGPEALLLVPGNHDVDRGQTTSVMVSALDDALRKADQDKLAGVLNDKVQRKLIHQRYTQYVAFLGRLGVAHPRTPSWTWAVEVRGVKLSFAGLDTALLHTHDDVQGRLVLGLAAVNAVLPPLDPASPDMVIALAHHPLGWLVQSDKDVVEPPLRARAHLLLRGHLHEPSYTFTVSPQHRLVELPAGASYAGHAWPMSFQLIELHPGSAPSTVHLFTWSRDWDGWVPDRNRLQPDGTWSFNLR